MDLSKVVHFSYRPIYHSSEPQGSIISIPSLQTNKHVLSTCLPSDGYPSHYDLENPQSRCLIILIASVWPGMPWLWDLVQLSMEIPLQLPVTSQAVSQPSVSPQPTISLLSYLASVNRSKNKASLWKWPTRAPCLSKH